MQTLILASPLITSAILILAALFLRSYLAEKAKVIANEAANRALEDYKLDHQKLLQQLESEHQRRLHEFSLYTREQHAVYRRLYKLARIAADRYQQLHSWFKKVPNYGGWSVPQVEKFVTQADVVETSPAQEVIQHYKSGAATRGAELLEALVEKIQRRDAEEAYRRLRVWEATNELYLSENVQIAMHAVRRTIGVVSALSDAANVAEMRLESQLSDMATAVAELLVALQSEMRRGAIQTTGAGAQLTPR